MATTTAESKLNRQILHGDILEKLKELPAACIDTIISSPPYWQQRNYGVAGQIGLESDFKDYLKTMQKIMTELKRVLKPSGSCWINLGDSYASGGDTPLDDDNMQSSTITTQNLKTGVQAKSRYGIPERFYTDCIDDGWIARNTIPWIKANPMPQSTKDRFSNVWESIYFFTKNNQSVFYFNEKTGLSDISPKPKNQLVGGVDWEYRKCISCAGTGYNRKSDGSKYCDCKNTVWHKQHAMHDKNDGQKHKRCKGNGIYRYSFWYARDYYFNLDSVREKTITESKPFNVRIRDNKKGRGQAKLTGGMSDGEDKMYDDAGILIPSNHKQDGILGEYENTKATAHRKSVNTPYPNGGMQSLNQRHSGNYDIITGESLNHPNGKNPGDVFYINVRPFSEAHFAVYPVELVQRILKCACPQQVCSSCGIPRHPIPKSDDFTKCECDKPFHPGIVLDPFFGSGSTGVAAEQMGLNWIGIEIKQEYIDIANKRLELYQNKKMGEWLHDQ